MLDSSTNPLQEKSAEWFGTRIFADDTGSRTNTPGEEKNGIYVYDTLIQRIIAKVFHRAIEVSVGGKTYTVNKESARHFFGIKEKKGGNDAEIKQMVEVAARDRIDQAEMAVWVKQGDGKSDTDLVALLGRAHKEFKDRDSYTASSKMRDLLLQLPFSDLGLKSFITVSFIDPKYYKSEDLGGSMKLSEYQTKLENAFDTIFGKDSPAESRRRKMEMYKAKYQMKGAEAIKTVLAEGRADSKREEDRCSIQILGEARANELKGTDGRSAMFDLCTTLPFTDKILRDLILEAGFGGHITTRYKEYQQSKVQSETTKCEFLAALATIGEGWSDKISDVLKCEHDRLKDEGKSDAEIVAYQKNMLEEAQRLTSGAASILLQKQLDRLKPRSS